MYHVVRGDPNMKMVQVHFRIPADKHKRIRDHGGYGVLQKICEVAVDHYLMECSLSGCDDELRLEIEEIRSRIQVERTRERLMHACMEEIAPGFAPAIAKNGLKRTILHEITREVREWWFTRFRVVPSDDEIREAVKDYVAETTVSLDCIRGDQVQRTMDQWIADHLEIKADPVMCQGRDIGGAREDCEI